MRKMLTGYYADSGTAGTLKCPVCNQSCGGLTRINRSDPSLLQMRFDCKCGAIVYLGRNETKVKKLFGSETHYNFYTYCYVDVDSRGNIINKRIIK